VISEIDRSRHFDRAPVTSGLPQQADNPGAGRHVSKGPIAEANVKTCSIELLPPNIER
jgi:hypothetical protein